METNWPDGAIRPQQGSKAHGLLRVESVTDPRGQPTASTAWSKRNKRMLPVSEDAAETLAECVKKCRVSSTPGELRLKKDLAECDQLVRQGIASFEKTPGNALSCQLTFLCPIEGSTLDEGRMMGQTKGDASTVTPARRVPRTYIVTVPKFYPHEPPTLYADRGPSRIAVGSAVPSRSPPLPNVDGHVEAADGAHTALFPRRFSRNCPFVQEDGRVQVPFLTSETWSSVSTLALVVQSLLEGLRNFSAGRDHPWVFSPQPLQGAPPEGRGSLPTQKLKMSSSNATGYAECEMSSEATHAEADASVGRGKGLEAGFAQGAGGFGDVGGASIVGGGAAAQLVDSEASGDRVVDGRFGAGEVDECRAMDT